MSDARLFNYTAVRKGEDCEIGREKQAGTHKSEPEPNEDRLAPASSVLASDLDAVGVQQKPGPLVVKLNAHTYSRKQTR